MEMYKFRQRKNCVYIAIFICSPVSECSSKNVLYYFNFCSNRSMESIVRTLHLSEFGHMLTYLPTLIF